VFTSKPGDPIAALDLLDDLGVTVRLVRQTGKLRVRPRPVPALARELLQANRALIHAVVLGRETGHAWARCDECGEGRMVRTGATPRCAMTPGCEGRHVAEGKETSDAVSAVGTTDTMAEAAPGPTVGTTRHLDDGIQVEELVFPDFAASTHTAPKHPAEFSDEIIPVLAAAVPPDE
jgi:hypothetical protein